MKKYYVIKDGRTVSDFIYERTAYALANAIGGEVATEGDEDTYDVKNERDYLIEQTLPYIVGTDYGDEKKIVGELGLGIGFDVGYQFAVNKMCNIIHAIIGDGFVRYGSNRDVADNDQFESMIRKEMGE